MSDDLIDLIAKLEDEREEAKDCSRIDTPWDPITAQRIANTMCDAGAKLAELEAKLSDLRDKASEAYRAGLEAAAKCAENFAGAGRDLHAAVQRHSFARIAAAIRALAPRDDAIEPRPDLKPEVQARTDGKPAANE